MQKYKKLINEQILRRYFLRLLLLLLFLYLKDVTTDIYNSMLVSLAFAK